MPDRLIDKIISELSANKYRGTLNWFSINEPLTDPRIFDIIKRSSRDIPSCKVQIYTNGDLLNQETLDKLFKCGLWRLRICVYDKKTHEKVKQLDKKDHYLDIWNNIGITKDYDVTDKKQYNSRAGLIKDLCYAGDEKYLNHNCPRPLFKMAIRYDGKLKLCAEDQTGRTFDDSLNLNNYSLLDLWYSPEMNYYRRLLKKGKRNLLRTCMDCNYKRDCRPI